MENNDVDTVDAYSELNYDVDSREYSHVASFLKGLGISRVRLITNNPRKVHALQRSGIEVQRVPVIVGINHWNIHYIETKKKKLNHLIGTEVPDQQVDGTEPDVVSSIPATVTDESAPAIVTSDSRPGTVTRNAKPLKEFTDLNVTVVGGFLMDAFIRTSALPDWGRAVQTEKLVFQPGGKGFNQAVAARRLGANVHVIGAIGSDKFGEQITHDLESYGIDTTGLAVIPGATTPVTIVFSRPGGETSFVGWKNSSQIIVDQALIRERSSLIASADVLLSTLEVSPEGVGAALTIAHDNGCMTVLNPAPPLEKPYYEPSDLPLAKVDLLIPNEWEAWELAGVGEKSHHTVESVASFLVDRLGAAAVCVTRAHHGCLFVRKQPWAFRDYPAFKATSDDTTGASDAFCATLALHLRAGYAIEEAIHQAQAAGAWSVRKQGAAAHMPTKTELDAHREYLEGLKSA
jgi:ribokinase